jgi:hypothetical protein
MARLSDRCARLASASQFHTGTFLPSRTTKRRRPSRNDFCGGPAIATAQILARDVGPAGLRVGCRQRARFLSLATRSDFLCEPCFSNEQLALLRTAHLHDFRPIQDDCDPDCKLADEAYWQRHCIPLMSLKPNATRKTAPPMTSTPTLPLPSSSDSYTPMLMPIRWCAGPGSLIPRPASGGGHASVNRRSSRPVTTALRARFCA